ncbi:MAG: S1C family serine protease, partial [Lachnospiraceae bacterium]|nr:S1C family serine protease [Lachnospiraceae bacterium]
QIEEILSQVEFEFNLEDYQALHDELRKLTENVSRAVVTVAGVTSDVDWFNNTYENVASSSGVIVANNEKAILILVSADNLKGADSIEVTFCDQTQVEAELVQKDENTGLAILSVPLRDISEETMDVIDIAELGSSNTMNLLGTPVIALGSPLGTSGSISYGVVTSTGTVIDLPDAAYKKITTDIYGSRNATGILINLKGLVIGIIDNVNTSNDMGNLLTAYGITELKRTIEQMSNDKERAYLGVHGADVPREAIEDTQINTPPGAYIRSIEIDSPAMEAGIQGGDVVIRINETEIMTYNELLNIIQSSKPEDVLTFTLMRQGHEMSVDVTLGSW